MEIIKNYNKALQVLYDHVGFKEDWVVYPIDDRTEMIWQADGDNVKYAETIEKFNSDGDYYVDTIYKQRFYKKYWYIGKELTMIFVDTHTDGNKFFAFYDNKKKVKASNKATALDGKSARQ